MRNLVSQENIYFESFQSIAIAKRSVRKTLLIGMSNDVRESYQHYLSSIGDLSKIESKFIYTGEQKEALLHCYNVSTEKLNEVLDLITASQPFDYGQTCQYCGIGDSNDTYDHYIPKELFPEFSVMLLNLVPCCGKCNSIKGSSWLNEENKRLILNFYFDLIPKSIFLKVKVSYEDDVPKVIYRLEKPNNMSYEFYSLIASHYSRLHLLERYKRKSNEVISEASRSILSRKLASVDAIKNELKIMSTNYGEQFGFNYYKSVLVDELSKDLQFINRLMAQ